MKKHHFSFAPFTFYFVVISASLLVIFYLFRVSISLSAFAYYQKFFAIVSQRGNTTITEEQHNSAITSLKNAIRYDSNNPKYAYNLGRYLLEYYAQSRSDAIGTTREQELQNVEAWLRNAAMLDPGSPWYYYELGRLGQYREDCPRKKTPAHEWKNCSVTRYFSAALSNAPNSIFLRSSVTMWYYRYDRNIASQLVWETIFRDKTSINALLERLWQQTQNYVTLKILLPNNSEITHAFSKFLYDKHQDYESDLEARQAGFSEQRESGECKANSMLRRSPGNTEIELGNDDGTAEWITYLASEEVRVKKQFCLPANLDRYNYAAVKIFMNSEDSEMFVAYISLDDVLIQQYTYSISPVRQWYEIPFDTALLQGKSRVHVYVRVAEASTSGNSLHIWGDQDTPTTRSVFNFDESDDLSFHNGIQRGEYMIRLILRRTDFSENMDYSG